ncbi:MAG: DoxX family protein [Actinomycetota bacterium]
MNQFRALAGYAPTVLRVGVGIVMAYHGLTKFQGGISNVAGFLASLGVPSANLVAPLLAGAELVGGVLLIVGLATRLWALVLALILVGAIFLVKVDMGLIAAQGVGAELDLALLVGAVAILFLGPGKLAADNALGMGTPA